MHSCHFIIVIIFILLLPIPAFSAEADDNSDIHVCLARMARPWEEKMHRLTREEYEGTLQFWAEGHAGMLSVGDAGASAEGEPIFLVKITDTSVPDTDKQVCLVSSLHGGPERSGTTAAMHLIEWLISDELAAVDTRRRQVVLVMPIVNPRAFFETDRFLNQHGIDPYTGGGTGNWDLSTLTYKQPEKCPELMTFVKVVDQYRPEVHVDLHGIGLQEFPDDKLGDRTMVCGQIMFEIAGSAYSNYALRPWDWRVTEAMVKAGAEAGSGADRFEADAQRCCWGPGMDAIADRLWLGRPRFYTAQYAYAKYHTMVMTFEVGYESTTLARLQALFEIGNAVWDGENRVGYPVDRMRPFCGHYVTTWGTTAEERRASRTELWKRQAAFTPAILYPQIDGRDMFLCAMTPEAGKRLEKDLAKSLTNLADVPGLDLEAIRAFVEAGPEVMFAVDYTKPKEAAAGPIEHGIGFRLRLPYHNPELLDLRLNGRLLEESATDGYESWLGNGYRQVQINVPPEKAGASEIFVVTCAYLPDQKRSFGWTPPQEVLDGLK